MRSAEPGWLRRHYDANAARYDKRIDFLDRTVFSGGRAWVCSKATGETLELAIGTGLNLPHYPPNVALTGIDLSPGMIDIARTRAGELGREVALQVGDAERLPFADESFDTVVTTLSLCTIPDDRQAIAEAFRVLRPGGRFLLMEHVRSPSLLVRLGQRAAEHLTLRFEGDHQLRDPVDHLEGTGFRLERLERSKWGIVERVAAVKPDRV